MPVRRVKGSCSICASTHASEYNSLIVEGLNVPQLNAVAARYQEGWSRPTWYRHTDHAKAGENPIRAGSGGHPRALVPQEPPKPLEIRKSSNQEFLETIRDIGYSKALERPEAVTMEQALKAASILEGRKDRDANQTKIMIGLFTGSMPQQVVVETVEGEAVEVSS